MTNRFENRHTAGRKLAEQLAGYGQRSDVLVLALPRGGVPVGYEVARALHVPLRVFIVRKLGVPGQEELAMGAVASGDIELLHQQLVRSLRIPQNVIRDVVARERRELRRRQQAYDGKYGQPDLKGRTIILVDDGIATGASMLAAVHAVRAQDPARVVIAVPVVAAQVKEALLEYVDEVASVVAPRDLHGVGMWYDDFRQTTDAEVRTLLDAAYRDELQLDTAKAER